MLGSIDSKYLYTILIIALCSTLSTLVMNTHKTGRRLADVDDIVNLPDDTPTEVVELEREKLGGYKIVRNFLPFHNVTRAEMIEGNMFPKYNTHMGKKVVEVVDVNGQHVIRKYLNFDDKRNEDITHEKTILTFLGKSKHVIEAYPDSLPDGTRIAELEKSVTEGEHMWLEYCEAGDLIGYFKGIQEETVQLGDNGTCYALKEEHWGHTQDLVWQLFDNICYIHERDVLHLDLKLDNVLLRKDDTTLSGYATVLADFGTSINMGSDEYKHLGELYSGKFVSTRNLKGYDQSANWMVPRRYWKALDWYQFASSVHKIFTKKYPQKQSLGQTEDGVFKGSKIEAGTIFKEDFKPNLIWKVFNILRAQGDAFYTIEINGEQSQFNLATVSFAELRKKLEQLSPVQYAEQVRRWGNPAWLKQPRTYAVPDLMRRLVEDLLENDPVVRMENVNKWIEYRGKMRGNAVGANDVEYMTRRERAHVSDDIVQEGIITMAELAELDDRFARFKPKTEETTETSCWASFKKFCCC